VENIELIDYGVCRLSLVPVRKHPADQAEQVTQLLFGEDYETLEQTQDKKWVRIRIHYDRYEGWIDSRQHHSITREYFEYISRAEFKITTDVTSSLLYNKTPLMILMGSIIPISASELFKMEEQFAFNGDSKSLGQKREYEYLKGIAFKYLHAPYQWGGKSPFGIDCSGFIQMVFKICGYRLHRDSHEQATQGKIVKTLGEAVPGDVAFFKNAENKIVHTGIILTDDRIIHASGRVRVDHINEEGILNVDTKVYTHTLSHIRRMLA
jgi:hypothetical protein